MRSTAAVRFESPHHGLSTGTEKSVALKKKKTETKARQKLSRVHADMG